jgi:hypothetical protein
MISEKVQLQLFLVIHLQIEINLNHLLKKIKDSDSELVDFIFNLLLQSFKVTEN